MKITHILGLTIWAGVLSGCFLLEDYPANVARLDSELNYICTTGIRTSYNSAAYQDCRSYYDSLLLQYDVNPSRPTAWEVSKFSDRTRPITSRCRGYSSSSSYVFSCVREQEDIMLAEWIRQKHIREHQEAERELIREQERERDRYARERDRLERDRYDRDHREQMNRHQPDQSKSRTPDNQPRFDKGSQAHEEPHMTEPKNKPHEPAPQVKDNRQNQPKSEAKPVEPQKESSSAKLKMTPSYKNRH